MNIHDDELNRELDEAPLLQSLGKSNPFEVPEGYFDHLSQSMKDKIEDEEVLKGAPILGLAGKEEVFEVPKGYFDQLPGRIMGLLPKKEGRVKAFGFPSEKRFSWAVAAAIALLMASILVFNQQSKETEPEPVASLENLEQEEIYDFLESAGVDSYDLMAALSEEETEEIKGELDFEGMMEEEIMEQFDMGELEDMILQP